MKYDYYKEKYLELSNTPKDKLSQGQKKEMLFAEHKGRLV